MTKEDVINVLETGDTSKHAERCLHMLAQQLCMKLHTDVADDYGATKALELAIAGVFKDGLVVKFNGRLRRALGKATSNKMGADELHLAKPVWPHITPRERYNVFTHELAHLLAEWLHPFGFMVGGRGVKHGGQWRVLHRALGGSGDTKFTRPLSDDALRAINTKASNRELARRQWERKTA